MREKEILFTFSHNDRDRVATLQLPLVGDRQGELVRPDLEARRCGNSAVCIFNLHAVGTPGGGADGERGCDGTTVSGNLRWRTECSSLSCCSASIRGCLFDSLCLLPVVGGDLLVVVALAAVQRGPVDGQRQLLLWPSVCYRGFVIFFTAERKKREEDILRTKDKNLGTCKAASR